MTFSDQDRYLFWASVRVTNDRTECWEWMRSRFRAGYGSAQMGGKNYYAHRVAYALAKGELVKGMVVMHSCDNPACCNPHHLSLGTHAENTADMLAKGRARRRPLCGEDNPASILTDQQVREVYRRVHDGENTRDLAKEYGISRGLVYNIKYKNARKSAFTEAA